MNNLTYFRTKKETLKMWWLRLRLNLLPAYFRTGGKITYISQEMNEIHVKFPAKWHTKGFGGILQGNTIYGAAEPIYSMILHQLLGKNYVIFNRKSEITYKKPAKTEVFAHFRISVSLLKTIKEMVDKKQEEDFSFSVKIQDDWQQTYAEIKQEIYIARRDFYDIKQEMRQMENNDLNFKFPVQYLV